MAKWVLWEQSPVGESNGDAACLQISHLLAGCWALHQSSEVPPELGAGPNCLSELEMGGRGTGCALGFRD